MHHISIILFTAFTIGLIGGAIPGPVLTSILTEVLEHGLLRSLRILFFAMSVEICVRCVATLLAGVLPVGGIAFNMLSLIGAFVLFRVAQKVWRIRDVRASGSSIELRTLALMIACNGVLWSYWLTVCAPDALRLAEMIPGGSLVYLGVFEIGWLLSTFGMACVFASCRQLLTHPKIMPLLFKIFSCLFAGFGVKMLVSSVEVLLRV